MADDDFDATRQPGLALYTHILQKGYQAGSVMGVGAVAPMRAAYLLIKHKQAVDPRMFVKTAGTTASGLFVLTAVLGGLRVSQIDQEGLEDRAYRLHYNKGQNRTDTFAQVGAVAGLAAGAALLRGASNLSVLHYMGSSAIGVTCGVLLHVLTRPHDD